MFSARKRREVRHNTQLSSVRSESTSRIVRARPRRVSRLTATVAQYSQLQSRYPKEALTTLQLANGLASIAPVRNRNVIRKSEETPGRSLHSSVANYAKLHVLTLSDVAFILEGCLMRARRRHLGGASATGAHNEKCSEDCQQLAAFARASSGAQSAIRVAARTLTSQARSRAVRSCTKRSRSRHRWDDWCPSQCPSYCE